MKLEEGLVTKRHCSGTFESREKIGVIEIIQQPRLSYEDGSGPYEAIWRIGEFTFTAKQFEAFAVKVRAAQVSIDVNKQQQCEAAIARR